ncbi:MAG: glutamine amidotransferase, partial [bacterium]
DKFYRQGIESRDELKHGYPQTKEDLFKYEAIIFGQIEAEYFREEQLQYTLDFVAQRGGGFLMLGGMSTFSLGGYEGTPIEKLLPVEISHRNALSVGRPATLRDKFKLVLTPEGLRSPILRLATDESENESLWGNMPDLVGYNTLGRAKPGATVLAVHPLGTKDNPKIVLANQRYGRGRSMVMATPSTWHWQMSMPHQDMSHERFWRQMLRWLALNSPKQIECRLDKESFTPFEEVTLKVDVRDSTFNYIENAAIKTIITTPSGKTIKIPFNWSSNGKVEYIGKFHPEELGLYTIEILAYSPNGDFIDRTEKAFFVEESMGEFTQAQLQSGLLKRIAEISGGQYFHQNEAQSLPDEIAVKQSSYSKLVEHDLWDMPLIFLLAIFLLTIEWTVCRSKGLS